MHIELVITAAFEAELPNSWLIEHGIPVIRPSGPVKKIPPNQKGLCIVITGKGPEKAKKAAIWIIEQINPLFVLNIGSAGANPKKYRCGEWIIPTTCTSEQSKPLLIDDRTPIDLGPLPIRHTGTLHTVSKPTTNIPDLTDMEAHAQGSIFAKSTTTFHVLKYVTDHGDINTLESYKKRLTPMLHG